MNIESGFILSDVGRSVSHDRVLCLLTQIVSCGKFMKLDVKLQILYYYTYNISKEHNLEIATKKDESIWFRWNGSAKNKNYYK